MKGSLLNFSAVLLLGISPVLTGADNWGAYRKGLEVKGIVIDYKKIIPKPVPPKKNFALMPLLNPPPRDMMSMAGPRPSLVGWQVAQPVDQEAWQEYFRNNGWPVPDKPGEPAMDVLFALRKYEDVMNQLTEAVKERPLCRFAVKYEDGFDAKLPHLTPLRNAVRAFILRSLAHLAADNSKAAMADLETALSLSECIKEEPLLISQLVRSTMLAETFQAVREGLAQKKWNAVQLAALEKRLAAIDLFEGYHKGMLGERVLAIHSFEQMRGDPDKARGLLGKQFPEGDYEQWMDKNLVTLNETHLFFYNQIFGGGIRLIRPSVQGDLEIEIKELKKEPDFLFTSMWMPSFNWMNKLGVTQAAVDQARIACLLELHQLKHKRHPARLADLKVRLPVDLMSGKPYVYKPGFKGRYYLYGVGWNQKDEGGKTVLKGEGRPDQKVGDVVWSYFHVPPSDLKE